MKAAILQSNYLPWRGVFDLINSVDVFIFHDDIQYTRQDWRNRNRIKTANGTQWMTVPVKHAPTDTTVDRTEIDYSVNWQWGHDQALKASLSRAPHYMDIAPLLNCIYSRPRYLSQLNQSLTKAVCDYLGIQTRLVDARDLSCIGKKTEKILALCQRVGATEYLSGPAARQYLDVDLLARNGITTSWKEYNYLPYPQTHGAYDGHVTTLDLIANLGPKARENITSITDAETLQQMALQG